MSARSHGVRRGPGRTLECRGGRRTAGLGMGWALAIPWCGGWVVGGEYPVYPPNPPCPHSRYPHPAIPPRRRHARNSQFGVAQGDPRGGIRTWYRGRQYPRALTLSARSSLPCSRLPTGGLLSVYLRFKYISVLGYLRCTMFRISQVYHV